MKHYSESKTVKFNAFMLALDAVLAPLMMYEMTLQEGLGNWVIYVIVALKIAQGAGNVYLRFVSSSPIGTKKKVQEYVE